MLKNMFEQWFPTFTSVRMTPAMWVFAICYIAWGARGFFVHVDAQYAALTTTALTLLGMYAFRSELRADALGFLSLLQQPKRLLTALALFVAALIAGTAVFSVLHSAFGLSEYELANDGAVANAVGRQSAVVTVLWMIIFGPLGEELFFRAFLIRVLLRGCSPVWAVFVSATIFGLVHASSASPAELVYVVPHIFAGIGFGLVAFKGGIVLTFLLHACTNFSSLLPMLLPT